MSQVALARHVKQELELLGDTKRAEHCKKYFKTGPGQYAEGDVFIGVSTPKIKDLAKKHYSTASTEDIAALLCSKIHEERMLALTMLVLKFQKTKDLEQKEKIFSFYILPKNIAHTNNWDLVDSSCYQIAGEHMLGNKKHIPKLYEFAKSDHLWTRRVGIVSTLAFVRKGLFVEALEISEILLRDNHDLIRKAVGWVIREVGKKNKQVMLNFLHKNAHLMSSITLSYATEKLDKKEVDLFRSLRKTKTT